MKSGWEKTGNFRQSVDGFNEGRVATNLNKIFSKTDTIYSGTTQETGYRGSRIGATWDFRGSLLYMKRTRILMCKSTGAMFLIFGVMFCSTTVMAGQFLKIEKIDAVNNFPKVKIDLTVNGIDGSLGALEAGDLVIIEDGSRIDDTFTIKKQVDSENYLYLVFSVDSSKSISQKFLKSIKSSAREIARSVGPKDRIAVYQFDDSVILLNDFSKSSDEIVKNINEIERHGKKTHLYDSIYDSIELFDKVKQANKKVIVFTDGKDEGSGVSEEDIITFARNAMIPVYFICCRDSKNLRSMARISKHTGGKLIYSKSNDVTGMYRTMLSVMKNRYAVTYPSKLTRDGMSHRLEVRIKYNDIRDRDADLFFMEKHRATGSLLPFDTIIIIIAIVVLFLLLIALFLYFMHREKEILKERFEIEKKYLMSQAVADGDRANQRLEDEQDALSSGDVQACGGAWVFQKNGHQIGKKYPINMKEITIGSGRDNAIVINDATVSEKHSKIKSIQGTHTLYDLISDQGTYLNDKKLLRPKVLHDWDEIKIGSIVLIFRASQLRNG